MKTRTYIFAVLSFYFISFYSKGVVFYSFQEVDSAARCFLQAYPDFFKSVKSGVLIDKNGKSWALGSRKKSFQERLNYPDLIDTIFPVYPLGDSVKWPLPKNYDPGRFRYTKLLKAIYGANPKEVKKNLVKIRWLPNFTKKTVTITKVNGVHKKIKAISEAIEKLPQGIRKRVYNFQGGYRWRVIKGTNRLSAHSFGIAVDVFYPDYRSYWKYSKPDKKGLYRYKNNFPMEIVKIFEKHGFIWGGKWYHYDSLHFEYRPELFCRK